MTVSTPSTDAAATQHALLALSPMDGRYRDKLQNLRPILSEWGLMRARLHVEVTWLIALCDHPDITQIPPLAKADQTWLLGLVDNFDIEAGVRIKTIEATTKHDVKAIEYYLQAALKARPDLAHLQNFIHFACTSEDINNLAHALMLKQARADVLVPQLSALYAQLDAMAQQYAEQPLLARTHGQPASPTTLGKELRVLTERLQRQIKTLKNTPLLGKINGATGNFNAHLVAYPDLDWPAFSQAFVEQTLGLTYNPWTTQIEPHDGMAELAHVLMRANTILIDAARDIWGYISLNYFTQERAPGQVGSSTMPHKINPIDFENAEGNLGIANALLGHFAEKLPISRWQRDLSDSTVIRNLGPAMGHTLLAYQAIQTGLGKLALNPVAINTDLDAHWEVLGEALQTLMRQAQLPNPYETLKALTQGEIIHADNWANVVEQIDLPATLKTQLKTLSPASYIGLAAKLASQSK